MLKDDELVGAIVIYRQEVRPFTDKQIELVTELRRPGRDRHREHAAAQRAAPAHRRSHRVAGAADRDLEVLKVISSSPGELEPVFQAMLAERDPHLRGQVRHRCSLREGDGFRSVAHARRAAGTCRGRGGATRSSAEPQAPASAASCRPSNVVHVRRHAGRHTRGNPVAALVDARRRAHASLSCRCSRTTNWSAPSPSTARRCGRSPTSRSSW